jgi:hypothetical protein
VITTTTTTTTTIPLNQPQTASTIAEMGGWLHIQMDKKQMLIQDNLSGFHSQSRRFEKEIISSLPGVKACCTPMLSLVTTPTNYLSSNT